MLQNFKIPRVVPRQSPHKHNNRGDLLGQKDVKYAATYQIGNATVHVIEPPPMTEEDKERILRDFHMAGWAIIRELVEKGEKV